MCNRCDNKAVAKRWVIWLGVAITLGMFLSSQIFVYGKVVGVFEEHIKIAPTYREITKELKNYVTKGEFNIIKEMIKFLYEKEGGK